MNSLNPDKLPLYYLSFNDEGIILSINKPFSGSLGYERSELEGQKIDLVFPVATKIFYQTHFFPLLQMKGRAEEIFIFFRAKNGDQVPVLLNAEKIIEDDVSAYTIAGILVNNRKKFEDELISAKEQAEKALKENTELIRTKEELSAQAKELDRQIQLVEKQVWESRQFNKIATHDLEEPLRKILTWANIYLQENPGETDKALLKLFTEIKNMQSTLRGLQEFVWLGESAMNMSSVVVDQVIRAAMNQLLDDKPGSDIRLSISGTATLKADSTQLLFLFYHLFDNSAQFCKPGEITKVNVTIRQVRKNEFKSLQHHYDYTDHIQVVYTDEGIGFDPSFNEVIFEPFRKLSHSRQQGLGLALCKIIAEKHNGSIEASGKPGEGSSFTIVLPMKG